ncbi:DNA polymerase alpha catalytic subunit [Eremomyces bilateralis CBS 781.70]|uniref:DNA polymerase n=1 Tax=Eremomyces bilateralis CBS 781.70 TaxID=1392243 RepID=A0A6G1G4P0_9PEZI|nr:DNA polymerase alpha catalytic subunit [Eremomyces bilateralis CBS 781.70]KAF1813024.1 DNA polymerase alpha catalytic subunit [Eremomyces bilateralis CBS 781.70]
MTSRATRLAQLRELRKSGKKAIDSYEVEEAQQLYEEVDEESYKKVVRGRLDQDDFVVDDNGDGYADDGREEWDDDRRQRYSSEESDEGTQLKGKAAKRKREEEREKKVKITNGISKYFNTKATGAAAKPKPVATAEDAAFMADLLGEVEVNIPSKPAPRMKPVKSETRRKVRVLSPPIEEPKRFKQVSFKNCDVDELDADHYSGPALDDDDYVAPMDDDVPMSDPMPSSPLAQAIERKAQPPVKVEEEEDDDMMEVAEAIGHKAANVASVNMAGSRPAPKIKKDPYPTPANSSPPIPTSDGFDPSTWTDVTSKLNVLSTPANETTSFGKLSPESVLEADGSFNFFWMDYTEVNGSLCLFGKVKDKTTDLYTSCFVKVDNILRKLYFLPREYRVRNGRDTEDEVRMDDVYQEVDALMSRFRVDMHKIKSSSRKYAFELPDIPKEADYLKLLYPYNKPAIPMDLKGETFSHVFGTNTALFEQFVLWKNLMGPCWLKIEGANFTAVTNASWCKLEAQVSKPALIVPLGNAEDSECPPLTLMSISLRTTFNTKENKQEILMVSTRIYENVSLADTTPVERLPCRTVTIMRPAAENFPVGFKMEAEKQKGSVHLERNEAALLSKFMAIMQRIDPDVLMGHKLEDVDYGILLSRMKERKTPGWHRIGRLKRSDWPKSMGKGGGSFYAERQLVAGRLLCDIGNDMGRSQMPKCQAWTLTEMCELYLGAGNTRQDINNETALKTWASTRDGLVNYLRHCEADTYFIAALTLKSQLLPLTKVLTNLAGNSWARTLTGTRAERNEYILLHEFYRNKYICPDKVWGKGKQKVEEENPEGEGGVDAKKKDKFKGGLVFEPEKGLYDKFILVMDFNSLYPSIIQEFNICFTTVDRAEVSEEEEKVPEVPEDQDLGILPRLIATLVSRRREVKKLMKDKTAKSEQLVTWDNKQMALKLTANSMYGCLGYTKSRFYARPLAMLTTFKGREILRSTKELAESNMLRVIYGDTDSVMINTNMDNMEAAVKIGNEFKRLVNDQYKLLEIDIDNIFRRILLHAKKKYAAINMVEVDGKYVEKLEVKGLDMRRREYCKLSKDTSQQLLNFLLSGEDPEVVVEKIHDYLRELSSKMREFQIPVQQYTIFTQLGKNPDDYPNGASMPSVQVAKKLMATGRHVKAKDVMSFVICGDSGGSAEKAAANAHTLAQAMRPSSDLKPDVDYYLTKQILPPVERLCAPIDGTNAARLAECLGLDPNKYRSQVGGSSAMNQETEIMPLESQIPDSIRFKNCAPLRLRCRACKHRFPFSGLVGSSDVVSASGMVCPTENCGATLPNLSIVAQLESQIRQHLARYYAGWLVCDDAACGARTRQMSVYGHRCLGPKGLAKGCQGRMQWEYGEREVYNQLIYLSSMFDVDKIKQKVKDGKEVGAVEMKEKLNVLADQNRERFGTLMNVVKGYLDRNGRRWVAMDSIFAFALKVV